MSVYVTSSKDKETFWKNVRHNENDPNCDFAVGARDGRVFPYIRALSTIPPGDEITVNFRAVDPAILNRFNCFADNVAKKLAAYEKGKLRQLSHANNKLYHANKKAADENAATEAKLLRSKRTLSMLLSKIDLKAENSVDADGELTSRLSVAVRSLLETTSSNNEDTGCYYGTPNPFDSSCQADITVAIDSSVAMLSSTNANNLVAWLANNLLPAFNLDGDHVQLAFLQCFGNGIFTNTDFNAYQTACDKLTGSLVDDGWVGSKTSPYEILRTYLLNQKQYGRPGYPQVLVLFTAINDDTLMNAWGMAKQVRDSGTTLLVVGLNQNQRTPYLYYLTDAFKSYPDFFNAPSDANVHPELPLWISQQACTRKAVKAPTSPRKPTAADPSLVNAVGTPCSSDLTHAWLDVQFYFDINIDKVALNDLGFQLAQTLASLTIDNKLPQASCFGLTAVDSNKLSDIYPLKSCVDYGTLYATLFSLGDMYSKTANTFFLNPVLDAAQAGFASRPNKRPQLLIIASKKLSSASINDPTKNKAKGLRDKGVYIVTVDYGNNNLEGIATPGQAYSASEKNLDDSLANVFGYANCVCPKGRSQLTVVDPLTNHSVPYADCYEVQRQAAPWMFAENKCEETGGTLVALNSVEKFSFVESLVKADELPAGSDYLIGLQRQRNNTLEWKYFGNQLLQVGKYPSGLSSTGYCGYVSQSVKGAPQIHLASCNKKAPYVCQYRSCDSSNFCEL